MGWLNFNSKDEDLNIWMFICWLCWWWQMKQMGPILSGSISNFEIEFHLEMYSNRVCSIHHYVIIIALPTPGYWFSQNILISNPANESFLVWVYIFQKAQAGGGWKVKDFRIVNHSVNNASILEICNFFLVFFIFSYFENILILG